MSGARCHNLPAEIEWIESGLSLQHTCKMYLAKWVLIHIFESAIRI